MKRWLIILGVVALAGLLAVLLLALKRGTSKPLTYQGKTMDYWFTRLPVTPVPPPGVDMGNVQGFVKSKGQQYGGNGASDSTGIEAFTAFGTNALPFLLARLQSTDSGVERNVVRAATNSGIGYLPFRAAQLERLQAVTGLIHLKTITPEARQLLTALRTNSDHDLASAAGFVLKRRAALGDVAAPARERKAEP
jgi:hypothetical protein